MRRLSGVWLIVALFMVFNCQGQNWTGAQTEVMNHIRGCWEAWWQAFEQKDPAVWQEACPADSDQLWWHTAYGAPRGMDTELKGIKKFYHRLNGKGETIELRPLSIKIEGTTAIVHFYASYIWEDPEGNAQEIEEKRLEVFLKKNGKWTLAGGMTAPSDDD